MQEKEVKTNRLRDLLSGAINQELQKEKSDKKRTGIRRLSLPTNIDQISVPTSSKADGTLNHTKVTVQKSSSKIDIEQHYCTQNQNYPLFFIEKAEAMHLKRIENIQHKEQLVAKRALRVICLQLQQWIHQSLNLKNETNSEFYDLLQRREERHFQIDRIIRYLST